MTSIHTFPNLPRIETDHLLWAEEDEDGTTWEDSQHPCEVVLDEVQDSQTLTQPETLQPPRKVHWPEDVVTSVHTFPKVRRSEVRRLFWSENLHQRVNWPENVVASVHTFPKLQRSEVRRLFQREEDKKRMGRDDRRRPWDLELDEDPEAQAQSESGCCVS